MIPGIYIYLKLKQKELSDKRKLKLSAEFRECSEILSSYINAGYSVENAFLICSREAERLFGKEAEISIGFKEIVAGIRMNKPVEVLLETFAETSGLAEIMSLAEVFSIAKRTGGDLKEIIDRTVNVIREKSELMDEIRNMTAAKRYEQKIMNILPFAVIIYINLTQSDFLNIMYEQVAGRIVMSICLIMFIISYFISRKMMNIEL
ncbi:MAG: type II secretion system F family protein [Eubacteriales bacterium]|nr:type II secretion system F family protein [Eubacteriales bacterium]